MREGDPSVHPGGRLLRAIWIQFACGEHHESLFTIDSVAINVNIGKVVVLTHGLQLIKRLLKRSVIPQSGIRKRLSIRGN